MKYLKTPRSSRIEKSVQTYWRPFEKSAYLLRTLLQIFL